jgi:hypothetical protein
VGNSLLSRCVACATSAVCAAVSATGSCMMTGCVQVLRDAEVVIQLIASDTDVEGTDIRSSRAIFMTRLTLLEVSCDVWMSNDLVNFGEQGQTQVVRSQLHGGGSVTHLAHLPVGKYDGDA